VSDLPLPLSATLVVGGAAILAVVGLLIVNRYFWTTRAVGENEVAGFLYAVIGVVYGVVLAFILVVVWQRFAATDQAVTTEAADLVAVFRDTQSFPDPLRQQAQDSLRAYAVEVMTKEWRSWVVHGEVVPHTTPDPLNPVWAIYRQVEPANAQEAAQLQDTNDRLHELERQRHLRHLASEATLPPFFWPVLVAGGVLTVGFSYFLRLENLWGQAAMTAVVAALITGILFLILSLDHPFTGQVHVDKEPFRHAMQQFNALNLTDMSGAAAQSSP
jgi:Protein of unknown function (DUF4239)